MTDDADGDKIMKVSAIVPAYNEGNRLRPVLEALGQAVLVDEIIVVNDGSADNTASAANSVPGVRVLDLKKNVGKGGAMRAGACGTDADIILFLDADLIGMSGEKIDSIVRPVLDRKMDMCIGVFRGGRKVTDLAQIITPYISGQRAMRRDCFMDMPDIQMVRSGIEVAITKFFRTNGLSFGTVTITGCTHVMKEEKLGWFRGFAARMRMYYDIFKIMLDGRRFVVKLREKIAAVDRN